jgi:hypothetical protein
MPIIPVKRTDAGYPGSLRTHLGPRTPERIFALRSSGRRSLFCPRRPGGNLEQLKSASQSGASRFSQRENSRSLAPAFPGDLSFGWRRLPVPAGTEFVLHFRFLCNIRAARSVFW